MHFTLLKKSTTSSSSSSSVTKIMYRDKSAVVHTVQAAERVAKVSHYHDTRVQVFCTKILQPALQRHLPAGGRQDSLTLAVQISECIATGERVYRIGPIPNSLSVAQIEGTGRLHCDACSSDSHPCTLKVDNGWFASAGGGNDQHGCCLEIRKHLTIPYSWAQMRSALITIAVLLFAIWLISTGVQELYTTWSGYRVPGSGLLAFSLPWRQHSSERLPPVGAVLGPTGRAHQPQTASQQQHQHQHPPSTQQQPPQAQQQRPSTKQRI